MQIIGNIHKDFYLKDTKTSSHKSHILPSLDLHPSKSASIVGKWIKGDLSELSSIAKDGLKCSPRC